MSIWQKFAEVFLSLNREIWLCVGLGLLGTLFVCLKKYVSAKAFAIDLFGGWAFSVVWSLILYFATSWGIVAILSSFTLGLMSRTLLTKILGMEEDKSDWFEFTKKMIRLIKFGVSGKDPEADKKDEEKPHDKE